MNKTIYLWLFCQSGIIASAIQSQIHNPVETFYQNVFHAKSGLQNPDYFLRDACSASISQKIQTGFSRRIWYHTVIYSTLIDDVPDEGSSKETFQWNASTDNGSVCIFRMNYAQGN